jgi:hypothetical protein
MDQPEHNERKYAKKDKEAYKTIPLLRSSAGIAPGGRKIGCSFCAALQALHGPAFPLEDMPEWKRNWPREGSVFRLDAIVPTLRSADPGKVASAGPLAAWRDSAHASARTANQ